MEWKQQWWEAPSHPSHHIWEPSRLLMPLSHWGFQDSISWMHPDLRVSPPSSAHFPPLVEVTVTLTLLAATSHCWLIKTSCQLKTQHLSLLLLTQVSHILYVSDGYSEPQCKQRSLLPFQLDRHSFWPNVHFSPVEAFSGPASHLPCIVHPSHFPTCPSVIRQFSTLGESVPQPLESDLSGSQILGHEWL